MYIAKNFIYLFCVIIRKKNEHKKIKHFKQYNTKSQRQETYTVKGYKGVVLKLTSKDKKQIEKYNAEIGKT